jgi:TPR repeat protein
VLAAGCTEAQNGSLRSGREAQVLELHQRAEQGEADAQFRLGVMYADGRGVPQNDAEAVRWFRLAAEQGNVGAQAALGRAYEFGRGVPQNDAEAVRWHRLAAEQGHVGAQFGLGTMYFIGRGASQDYVEAYKWLNLAAAADNANAREYRDRIMQRMTPAQIEEGQRRSAEWQPTNGPQQ